MFPEGSRFVQEINEVTYMLSEEKFSEVLRSAESRPKRENAGAGIYRLVISFDGNTYKSGGGGYEVNNSQNMRQTYS